MSYCCFYSPTSIFLRFPERIFATIYNSGGYFMSGFGAGNIMYGVMYSIINMYMSFYSFSYIYFHFYYYHIKYFGQPP